MKTGTITLFDASGSCLECKTYKSFEDRIGILNEWKRHFKVLHGFYQIEPDAGDLILSIKPINKRAKILLSELNKEIPCLKNQSSQRTLSEQESKGD
jgi:hypothetical protein